MKRDKNKRKRIKNSPTAIVEAVFYKYHINPCPELILLIKKRHKVLVVFWVDTVSAWILAEGEE